MAALAAIAILSPSTSFAQKAFSPKIKTPDTSKEIKEPKTERRLDVDEPDDVEPPKRTAPAPIHQTAAQRKLRQHGLGLGLGQTFLFSKYAKYGQDKITADLLYTYAASYSFDILVDAHMSEHKDNDDRMQIKGLTTSFKGRLVEFDNFSPYFLGGLGFYAPRAKRGGKWTQQKITFGLNFGGGLDLRLNDEFVVGVMSQVHVPFKVQQDTGSDLQGYYMKLLLTGMYLF